jgi:hypothetical protein
VCSTVEAHVARGGLAFAAAPTLAASPAGSTQFHATLSDRDLSKLPLTDRHLNRRERVNLATVLGAYHAAEGASLDPDAFVNSFTKDGVFTSVVVNQSYRGDALRNVAISTAALFPDAHRDLRSITVRGDKIEKFNCLIGFSAELNQLGIDFDWAGAVARG